MSDTVMIALIPIISAAIAAAWKIAREQGRADEYQRNAEKAITQKNEELDETKAAHREEVADLKASLAECRRNCAALRRQLEANP